MNPLPASSLATRRLVWVCPRCGQVLAKGLDGTSYLDPAYDCWLPASVRRRRAVPLNAGY